MHVGWAKRSVPTIRRITRMVGTARCAFAHPTNLAPGDAYVPEGFEKHVKLVIDVVSRKIAVE